MRTYNCICEGMLATRSGTGCWMKGGSSAAALMTEVSGTAMGCWQGSCSDDAAKFTMGMQLQCGRASSSNLPHTVSTQRPTQHRGRETKDAVCGLDHRYRISPMVRRVTPDRHLKHRHCTVSGVTIFSLLSTLQSHPPPPPPTPQPLLAMKVFMTYN